MTSAHDHHSPAANLKPFTDQEWAQLQKDDILAGGMIVGLMTGIFTIGLVLYFSIAMIAWAPPV
jgi:hypothetical protein